MTVSSVIATHRAAGREFSAAGVRSFVLDQGDGEAVVCLHGVPASAFLYRKVVPELAARGLRGVAFDLPGLGLAERPTDFDYSWTGLAEFCAAAVDALELDRFHLVVHDIGGPIGFELAARMPERVSSMLILNTLVEAASFKRPWSMEPFARRGIGELYLRALTKPAFRMLMGLQGIGDRSKVPTAEIDAYVDLLKREDSGRAFLRIMRGFERTAAKQQLYESVLGSGRFPIRVLWGAQDPALPLATKGEQARRAAGVDRVHTVDAKHFLQEDQPAAVAEHVAALAAEIRAG